ncbi:MAG TPA: C40 family peptidase [Mucilaginibacter sp.]
MRKEITLIILLIITAASVNNAYAHKSRKAAHRSASVAHHSSKKHHSKHNSSDVLVDDIPVVHFDNSEVADSVTSENIITFAESLLGTRYRSATADPDRGFDCSGFVNYVFSNFNFKVPRSSGEFAGIGERINYEDARPGDIILFTSPTNRRRVGHVGIVYSNDGEDVKFIHSTSGKEHGVTISTMDETYKRRFVRVVRILRQNDTVLASR